MNRANWQREEPEVQRKAAAFNPSIDGTSRMMREYQVRICERLGVKFPGPTRHKQNQLCLMPRSGLPSKADMSVCEYTPYSREP
jgi:hypothetical protein